MSFELSQVEEAYIKLKSYVYYDNTDILLRKQLVEFETNRTKDFDSIYKLGPKPYKFGKDAYKLSSNEIIKLKLNQFTKELNNYHSDPEFFNFFIDKVRVNFYPKKIKKKAVEDNFVSNKRVEDKYPLDRVTAFIDAPIELHILSVLWILEFGISLDSKLNDCCLGNRLLLNKEQKKVVKGSGLFKPYFKQYQKWRDDSVQVAKELLEKEKNVLFLNLDIRDYFHSVRIPIKEIFKGRTDKLAFFVADDNLKEVFLNVHLKYTALVGKHFQVPYNFYSNLKGSENGDLQEVILPIGLLSSYVLGNSYLKDFDKRINEKIKPAYYGRYVDDILIVLSDPNPHHNEEEICKEISFSFDEYKGLINENGQDETISFFEKDLSALERYILVNFYPVIKLTNSPDFLIKKMILLILQEKKKLIELLNSVGTNPFIFNLKSHLFTILITKSLI